MASVFCCYITCLKRDTECFKWILPTYSDWNGSGECQNKQQMWIFHFWFLFLSLSIAIEQTDNKFRAQAHTHTWYHCCCFCGIIICHYLLLSKTIHEMTMLNALQLDNFFFSKAKLFYGMIVFKWVTEMRRLNYYICIQIVHLFECIVHNRNGHTDLSHMYYVHMHVVSPHTRTHTNTSHDNYKNSNNTDIVHRI